MNQNEDVPPPKLNLLNKRGLIAVIHVTTSTVFISVYNTNDFKRMLYVKEEIQLMMPKAGWFEEDAADIMTAIYQCCSDLLALLESQGQKKDDIYCIAIANQRETTVIWDSETGQPLYRSIVWNDIRTSAIADKLYNKLSETQRNELKKRSGLVISPYFSALKIRWLMDNVPAVKAAIKKNVCKVGTLDSWIVWNLTKGKLHITDVTNASRTMLMNIHTLNWDEELLKAFGIPSSILPKIRSCSETFGRAERSVFKDINICGIIGDQQASLVGQMCLDRGQANCNYNLGCFLLCNTGMNPVDSSKGLLTTIAYKMGPNARTMYALEGSVAVGGRAFDWLNRKLQILPNFDEAEMFAKSVPSTEGIFFVPAFTGLYAPYWCKSARGIIIGLTRSHNSKHIVRAAHEAICYQVRDILECMRKDCGLQPDVLYADGRLSENQTLMQMQADISGIKVVKSSRPDCASFGAALIAAHVYDYDITTFKKSKDVSKNYEPKNAKKDRDIWYRRWCHAVERSKYWIETEDKGGKKEQYTESWDMRWLMVLLFIALAFIILAKYNWKNTPMCQYGSMRSRRRCRMRRRLEF